MTQELAGRVAIVTGGASGIGAATAETLAGAGAQVVIADLQDALGRETAERLGGRGHYRHFDVVDEAAWQALVEETVGRFGRLDVLVNNAGIGGGRSNIETCTLEAWNRTYQVNVDGVFLGCKAAIAGMKRTGKDKPAPGGSIINISSVAGIVGSAGPLAYTASKGAVRLLTKSVALHCAESGYGIRCNSVHPGGIETPILEPFFQKFGREQVKAHLGGMHPVGHMGVPRDIAEAVLYLASDRSAFVTGAELVVDGGITATLKRFSLAS